MPWLGEHGSCAALSALSAVRWHVLHVKPNQERFLSRDLEAMGVSHFLPLTKEIRYRGRRKQVVESPLFPGYLFLHGSLDDAYRADRTKRVVHIIKVADQRRLEWELKNLGRAVDDGIELDPYPYLKEGHRVEIRSGPYRGYQGVVESRSRADRLLLQVHTLGTAVSFEIHGALLEPLEWSGQEAREQGSSRQRDGSRQRDLTGSTV